MCGEASWDLENDAIYEGTKGMRILLNLMGDI